MQHATVTVRYHEHRHDRKKTLTNTKRTCKNKGSVLHWEAKMITYAENATKIEMAGARRSYIVPGRQSGPFVEVAELHCRQRDGVAILDCLFAQCALHGP
jgi:hypothetical protein